MDTAVIVAFLGLLGVLVSSVIGAHVATNTNKVEKKKVAGETVESVLRERMVFRDERIQWLEQEIADLEETITKQDMVIRELREQLHPERDDQ